MSAAGSVNEPIHRSTTKTRLTDDDRTLGKLLDSPLVSLGIPLIALGVGRESANHHIPRRVSPLVLISLSVDSCRSESHCSRISTHEVSMP